MGGWSSRGLVKNWKSNTEEKRGGGWGWNLFIWIFLLFSANKISIHYFDIEKLSGTEFDISPGDREKVPEAYDGICVNESQNIENVAIVYCIWLVLHELVSPLF